MIHNALRSIPSRPVKYLAPALILIVLTVYYLDLKSQCSKSFAQRQNLIHSIQLAKQNDQVFKLSSITDFEWDFVKGFIGFKPKHPKKTCPFGWDWSKQVRQTMIEQNKLSVFIFFKDRNIVNIQEFSSDDLNMENLDQKQTPESAIFNILQGDDQNLRLELVSG